MLFWAETLVFPYPTARDWYSRVYGLVFLWQMYYLSSTYFFTINTLFLYWEDVLFLQSPWFLSLIVNCANTFFLALVLFVQHPLFYHFFYHFIVKSHVLFVLHPSFLFIGKLYYSYNPHDFHLYFFYLLNTYLFFAKLYYSLYTPFFFNKCTICTKPQIFTELSFDICTIPIKPMILEVNIVNLYYSLYTPFLCYSTDVLFAQYSWFLWLHIKIY